MIKLTDLLKENLRSGDVSKLQKGLERVLGTSINSDINSAGAHEFYINNAKFMIGIGDGIDRGTKFSFNIYDDGARKTLASGTSDNVNDIIKQTLVAAKKHKNSLLQTESVNEEESFTATSKKTGQTSVFKSKDARDAAVKAGTHSKIDDKEDDKSKGEKKPNMFSKDAGYDAPDAKSDNKLSLSKKGSGFDMTAASKLEDELGGGISDLTDDGDITFAFGDNDRETSLFIGREGDTYKVSVENPYGDDFGGIETFDNEADAIAHSKKLAKKYSKELGAKSEPKSDNLPLDDSGDGFTGKAANHISNELSKAIGIDGNADINDNGTIEFAFGDSNKETSLFIGREGGTYNVSVENPYGDDFGGIETFDNEADAIAHSKKLAKKYSKELGAKSEKKTSEPKTNTPKVKPRKANKALVKTVDKFSKRIGLNPDKLGKEDYEKKMLTLVHDALEDANFHSANRQIFADLYGKPELAKRPDYSNAPGFDSPEREEWEEKNSIYGKRFKSTTADFDDSDEMVGAITSQASWDGQDTIDAILDKMRKDGSNDLADKIQSSFDKDMAKNEGTIKLTDLI